MDINIVDRFFKRVFFTPMGCWFWTGPPMESGYGQLCVASGKREYAHRFAYEYIVGPIVNLDAHHTCGIRLCVNPDHIKLMTKSDHMKFHKPITWDRGEALKLRGLGFSWRKIAAHFGLAESTLRKHPDMVGG